MVPSTGAVDPLAEKYIRWSEYNYVLGNPLKYVDPDGRFVIVADNQKDRRALRKMVRLMKSEVKSWSDEQWTDALEITGFDSKRDFRQMFKNGRGPKISFSKESIYREEGQDDVSLMAIDGNGGFMAHSAYALTRGNGDMVFDPKIGDIIDDLRQTKKKGKLYGAFSPGNGLLDNKVLGEYLRQEEIGLNRFLVGVFGHEIGHSGANLNGKPNPDGNENNPNELGFQMERRVLGGVIDHNSPEVGFGVNAFTLDSLTLFQDLKIGKLSLLLHGFF